jgi:Cu(I)/Ag(I) efflux system membrane fusion protein
MYETANPMEPRPGASSGRRRWIPGLGIVALVCAAYAAGHGSRRPSAARGTSHGEVLYYVDPMHPSYRSERPGKAPDCGMDLEPVYAGVNRIEPAAVKPGSIRLTPDQEQTAGLQTETAEAAPTARAIHTVGRVAPDEALTYRVSAGVDGWVRRVFTDRTGTQVKGGERLAAFYSKDISAPQQAYVYALESYQRLKQTPSPPADPLALATQQLATARDNLQFLGMGEAQIEELGRTRSEVFDVDLTAPADGQILERHVAVGQRFMKGELLYRIADLKHVWVLAVVHPGDAAWQGVTGRARIRMEGLAPLKAEVAAVPPQFDEQGRTGTIRLQVDNPSRSLVPGMIVNVDLDVPARSAITVHADAVIDSGTAKRVFLALGDGQYELREVETGWQEGDRVEIRAGLKVGERVVTAGAFLLDSESRMKSPPAKVTDAECGMKIDRANARRMDSKGATYYFCSEACERKFAARGAA